MTNEPQTTTGASFDRSILQQATATMREHAIAEATRLVIGYAETSAQIVASRFQDIAAIADSLLLYNLTGTAVPPIVSATPTVSESKLIDLRRDALQEALNFRLERDFDSPDEHLKAALERAHHMVDFILSGQPVLPSLQPSPSSTASPQPQDSSAAAVSVQPLGEGAQCHS